MSGHYPHFIGGFTTVRARVGDRDALDEYASWIQAIEPRATEHSWREALEPLWTYPEHAAVAKAARAMFLDPDSHWLPLLGGKPGRNDDLHAEQFVSPLACVPAYREALIAALGDKTKFGTAVRKDNGVIQFELTAGRSGGFSEPRNPDPDDKPGITRTFRVCDFLAWKLSQLDGAPECMLTWTEPRRDEAVAACAAYLKRFGPRLAVEANSDDVTARGPFAQPHFPALDHPATPDDVREGRALFSIHGEGETRVVALPAGFPVRARWLALKSFPIDREVDLFNDHGDFLQDGRVWQAEEVLKDGQLESKLLRFYWP